VTRRARARRAGVTLLELLIALTAMVIGMLGFAQVMASSATVNALSHETALAREAGRRTIELLQSEEFAQVYALYNSNPADDPIGGPGSAPGSGIDVAGLQPMEGDVDGLVGEILFPTSDVGGVLALREDVRSVAFGTPRDLNGDGVTDGLDHASDYQLLPVVVRFQWRSSKGTARFELRTLLANLQ
jgi:hypothetical protein